MGISGIENGFADRLLPLLKSIQKPCSLKKFAGQTIGVDAYGWLHRGTVACAIDLALGKPTNKYVDFSMHRVRMLIHFGVIPYLVFDGDYLPSKATTETQRAKKREESKRKGLELYHLNRPSQAHLELQKAVDVTPEMARDLIDELKKIGVQYIVAPYEADAQLVYLERQGVIQGMLSEDSDLLVFGAKCLLTKLDQYGDCVEINRADFTACRDVNLVGWSDAEFRRMAILSGCDYLASISRMGLKSAYRYVRKYKSIEKILQMLAFDGQYHVPPGYLEKFYQAELTFLHQRVFCPVKNDIVMMTDVVQGAQPGDLSFIGNQLERTVAIGVAKGDLDPMTKQPIPVQSAIKSVTKTPLVNSRRDRIVGSLDAKTNKSIESFFKAKRTPLAELDLNSLNPSPTQVRLLQRAGGVSWEPSPAPVGPPNLQSCRSMLQNEVGPALSAVTPITSIKPDVTRIKSTPAKRRRLCFDSDENQDLKRCEPPGTRCSPYFPTKQLGKDPSREHHGTKRRTKEKEIMIWSDDSIEDAMVELSNVQEPLSDPNISKIDSLKESDRKSPELAVSDRDSQFSMASKRSEVSNLSRDTQATSVTSTATSVAETLDEHNTTEVQTAPTTSIYQPLSEKVLSQLRDVENGKSPPNPIIPAKMGSTSQTRQWRNMTPLQRLGAGALNRSSACGGSLKDVDVRILNPVRNTTTVKTSQIAKLGASVMTGSEDAIIPDSEDSADDVLLEKDEGESTKIDVGCFALAS
ncbi:Rad2 nuclease [Lecanora helva]